jgi:tetratricopeptide (TPR) repeat protein
MTNVNPAWDLYTARRFEEAIAAYRMQLKEQPDNKWSNMHGLAESLMGAGQYAEAIPLFEEVSANRTRRLPASAGYLEQISVCHWMGGDRQKALEVIRELVMAVRDGRITFTDFAGGVSQGLILCYMAITLRSNADVDLAMNYLKTLASRPRIKNWPGPAALFLLGGLTFGEAMKNAADTAQTKPEADQDGWKRRYLAALLFTAGTERRMAGDEQGARMFFNECAGLTNPLVEYEWYLAKSEISASS